jgi:glycosyltransferase involved in cell wall biosynthesis
MIITDLPYYVNSKLKESSNSDFIFAAYQKLFIMFNKYVLITEEINTFLSKSREEYIVIDGFITLQDNKRLSAKNRNTKTVIYAGTLDLDYGVRDLIELARMSYELNIEFLVFGYTNSDKLKLELSENPNLKYHGFLEKSELIRYYENADAFIIPRPLGLDNNQYSNPSKLYEYLSYNKPVIVNDLPSIPSDLKDILLVNKNRVHPVLGFYQIINDLLSNNLFSKQEHIDILKKRQASYQLKRYVELLN